VRPEYLDVLQNISDAEGTKYRDDKGRLVTKFLVEVGGRFDLGRFRKLARVVIRKNYADQDWSQYSERFGTPFLMVKTSSRNKKELDRIEEMAANFGSNSYGIFDDNDSVELLERKEQNGHLVFADRLADARNRIATLINGQSSTSDQKAFVGAAEVHERVLNELTLARLKYIENTVNDALVPVLVANGYDLQGCRFSFKEVARHEAKPADEPASKKKALT
jgi:phage gp29-like protein